MSWNEKFTTFNTLLFRKGDNQVVVGFTVHRQKDGQSTPKDDRRRKCEHCFRDNTQKVLKMITQY